MNEAPDTSRTGGPAPNQAAGSPIRPLDAFARLQQQIELAVVTLDQLRAENERLGKELASTQEMLQLTQDELDRLLAERNEVCQRIESVMSSLTQAGFQQPRA